MCIVRVRKYVHKRINKKQKRKLKKKKFWCIMSKSFRGTPIRISRVTSMNIKHVQIRNRKLSTECSEKRERRGETATMFHHRQSKFFVVLRYTLHRRIKRNYNRKERVKKIGVGEKKEVREVMWAHFNVTFQLICGRKGNVNGIITMGTDA